MSAETPTALHRTAGVSIDGTPRPASDGHIEEGGMFVRRARSLREIPMRPLDCANLDENRLRFFALRDQQPNRNLIQDMSNSSKKRGGRVAERGGDGPMGWRPANSIEDVTLQIAESPKLPAGAVTRTFAIPAEWVGGKTYPARVFVEELLENVLPVVACDPAAVRWRPCPAAGGKSDGFPIVVLGGEHGDVPLESTAGTLIADLIAEGRPSAVIDLSLFRKGEHVRFMTDSGERLDPKNRHPLHLVPDEADAFAPQRPMRGQERMLGAVVDLVHRGRARGLDVTLATRRAAVVNQDFPTQVEVLVALRTWRT
jgi:hypothetical protein